jgi:hypothetical protein
LEEAGRAKRSEVVVRVEPSDDEGASSSDCSSRVYTAGRLTGGTIESQPARGMLMLSKELRPANRLVVGRAIARSTAVAVKTDRAVHHMDGGFDQAHQKARMHSTGTSQVAVGLEDSSFQSLPCHADPW